MARLTEEMVIARSRQSDLSSIKKLNCWGGELVDVTILRRMPNVEVLALSINKIRSLSEFASCRRLKELYIRKNEIQDLREIRHLRHLPLESLWLDENPCTDHHEYRMTVLRNLPNLEKLDNVPVNPEEVSEAMRRGVHIPDSDEESETPTLPNTTPLPSTMPNAGPNTSYRSSDSSPDREEYGRQYRQGSDETAECSNERTEPNTSNQCPLSPETDERSTHSAMTRSHYEPSTTRSPEQPLRHSHSAQSVKEYNYPSNGECRQQRLSPPPQYDQYYERNDRPNYSQPPRSEVWERDSARSVPVSERDNNRVPRERDRDSYHSAVMSEHRGFTRRPTTRSSNLLSAVLCLVKELDYTSLEVAEMAVRCRMDELANAE